MNKFQRNNTGIVVRYSARVESLRAKCLAAITNPNSVHTFDCESNAELRVLSGFVRKRFIGVKCKMDYVQSETAQDFLSFSIENGSVLNMTSVGNIDVGCVDRKQGRKLK